MSDFQNVLRSLREREKLTQAELAEKLEISKSAISMYENGNREPDFEQLEAIADFFNVDMDYLTGRSSVSHYILDPNDITSDDEKAIIKAYRLLSDAHKQTIKEMIDFYIRK